MILRFPKSREAILLGALLALLVLVESRFSGFAAPGNLAAVFNDTSILIIPALGQTLVILTPCIDLSVASNRALTGMVTAKLNAAFPGIHHRACLDRHGLGFAVRRWHAGADRDRAVSWPALWCIQRCVGHAPRPTVHRRDHRHD
ncbi:hypothetical protein P775_27820 [Puniceibacterium antarcticum]|uniref:ABC transporter permease n=1 Tax=Puniceibacterium antarcticum TaxID=1206336 RepID=A0A2G8QWT9_9RHOB|nr:hypothetical protein P775_27820 [Puniceibacterium antarcticum]